METALARTETPQHGFGSLVQQAPQPQGLAPTVVPLDRETLTFYGNMVQAAGLVPYDSNTTLEMSKARVMAKIVAGVSYGFDPILSQQCFDVVFNRMVPNAHGLEILFRDSGEFDTRIVYLDPARGCKVNVLKRVGGEWNAERGVFTGGTWTIVGEVEFTIEMAEAAGLLDKKDSQWKKYPADMAYSKVMKRVVKRFHPGCQRPRTLLGNYFAKAHQPAPVAAPDVPQIQEAQHISEEPHAPANGRAYVDPPYTGSVGYVDATEDDDGAEASVVEFSGPPPQQHAAEEEPEAAEPETDDGTTDLRLAIKDLFAEKLKGDILDIKKFLKGRELDKMSKDALAKLHGDLLAH